MAKRSPVDRFEQLFAELSRDKESVAIVARSRLRLLFEFSAPPGALAIDGRSRPFTVERDGGPFQPDLTLAMSCETADRFFKGTLDLTKALAAKEITSKGSIFKMLELRALLQRAREMYRQIP